MGEVSNRRAWHEPAKLTAEVLEHYKRPLRARNWDAALVEVRLPAPTPNPLHRLHSASAAACWPGRHISWPGSQLTWSAYCCRLLHSSLPQLRVRHLSDTVVTLPSQVSRLPREVTERQLAGLCGAAARLPAAVATGAHDRVSPTTCAAQLVSCWRVRHLSSAPAIQLYDTMLDLVPACIR